MSEREIDSRVAAALGLEVVGEAWCFQEDNGTWCISFYQQEAHNRGQMRKPVYLDRCVCGLGRDDIDKECNVLGHFSVCLEVVPSYSTDIRAACQIWDTLPWPRFYTSLVMTAQGQWRFGISSQIELGIYIAREAGSRPMAICLGFLAAMHVRGSTKP